MSVASEEVLNNRKRLQISPSHAINSVHRGRSCSQLQVGIMIVIYGDDRPKGIIIPLRWFTNARAIYNYVVNSFTMRLFLSDKEPCWLPSADLRKLFAGFSVSPETFRNPFEEDETIAFIKVKHLIIFSIINCQLIDKNSLDFRYSVNFKQII